MINAVFIMIQLILIILVLGGRSFFTNKERFIFFGILFVYALCQRSIEKFSDMDLRIIDSAFFFLVYLLEIFFIYRRKHSLFLAAVFTIMQNSILVVIWTSLYDFPLQQEIRREVYADSILIQSTILITILTVISILDKKFKFTHSFLAVKKKYNFYSVGMMASHSILLVIRQLMLFSDKMTDYFYLTIILIAFSIIYLMIIYFINSNYKKKMAIETFSKELSLLENKNNLYQEFRHDYNNILISLNGYLQKDDTINAKKYLNSLISYSSEIVLPNYYFLIKKIPVPAVQSILLNAVKKGKESDLNIILDIQDFPNEIAIDLIDFIRCLSILIDNALEHSAGKVFISFYIENDCFQVSVKNTYGLIEDVTTMFKRNYSTKEDHSGIGLYILQKILNSYTNTSYSVDKDTEWISFSFTLQ